LAAQLIRGVFPLDTTSSAGSGSSGPSPVFSGHFRAEEIYGVGNKASGGTTTADVKALLEVFLNMSPRPVSFTDNAFFS